MVTTELPEASAKPVDETTKQIGQFHIIGRIGAGGMGEVYRALDENLQREVAIKVLPESSFADTTARVRLLREARSAAALNHPNICTIHEVGESSGQAYIAMECVEGETLAERIRRAPLSTSEVIRFGLQLADALAHAHGHGIIHRDLKPANVIITPEQRLKVLDFGLAKRLAEASDPGESTDILVTARGAITGTPAYLSPEQLRGMPADERSDVWALGVILYEMVTGKRPFDGNTWPELSAAILTSGTQPLPLTAPPELEMIIRRCLEKEPANRYSKAIEVRSALEIIQSSGTLSRPLPLPTTARRWGPFIAVALIVLIALLVGLNLDRLIQRFEPAERSSDEKLRAAAVAIRPHAVAVLPFANLSGGDEEYLADAMQDSVIGELARVKDLRVVSRTSTLQFKDGKKSALEIARTLNADNLVEGSVIRSGDRIRVQVKLIRTSPEEQQVWSEAYERTMSDLLPLYGEIARAVAVQVDSRLAAAADSIRTTPERSVDPEMYKLYLRGRYQLNLGGKEGFAKAIQLFRQASELDPSDPLPYAGLSLAYAMRVHDGFAEPDDPELAKAAARKSLSMDPELTDANAAIALVSLYVDWNWKEAGENFSRTLERDPSFALIRRHYAWYLVAHRKLEEGLAQQKAARDSEPMDGVIYVDIALILTDLGRVDEALPEARKALELAPDNPYVLLWAGTVYAKKGMFDQALKMHRKVAQLDPSSSASLARTLIMAGRRAEAGPIIEELRKKSLQGDSMATGGLVTVYAELGRKEDAIRMAALARDQKFVYTPWIGIEESTFSIADDPRFKQIRASIGLP